MTQTLILTPRDRRSAAFFWLGVGVLPVFWSWFTIGKQFPKWQRYLALGWMLVVMAVFVVTWPHMSERYHVVMLGLPMICIKLSFWLSIWLLLRMFPLGQLLIFCVVMTDVIAILSSLCVPMLHRISLQSFSLGWVLMPLVPAMLHLAVEPMRRIWARLETVSMSVRVFWICIAILPTFFVWFTIDKYFTKRERIISWSWAAIFATVVLMAFPPDVFVPLVAAAFAMAVIAIASWLSTRSKE